MDELLFYVPELACTSRKYLHKFLKSNLLFYHEKMGKSCLRYLVSLNVEYSRKHLEKSIEYLDFTSIAKLSNYFQINVAEFSFLLDHFGEKVKSFSGFLIEAYEKEKDFHEKELYQLQEDTLVLVLKSQRKINVNDLNLICNQRFSKAEVIFNHFYAENENYPFDYHWLMMALNSPDFPSYFHFFDVNFEIEMEELINYLLIEIIEFPLKGWTKDCYWTYFILRLNHYLKIFGDLSELDYFYFLFDRNKKVEEIFYSSGKS